MNKLFFTTLLIVANACSQSSEVDNSNPTPTPPINQVDVWLTKPDESVKLQKQNLD